MPKPKIHTKGNPITPLPEKNRYIFRKVIPTLKEIQKQKNTKEMNEMYASLNKVKSEIHNYAKEIYKNLDSRNEMASLNPRIKKQVFEFIESEISKLYLQGIDRYKKLDVQSMAEGLIKEMKDHKEKSKVKKEIISRIKNYDALSKADKQKINEIVNYNLALITKQPYLTLEQTKEFKKKVTKDISKL